MCNIVVIIQARTGSSRYPEKVLEILDNKPLLLHVVDRVKLSKTINNIVIATTTKEADDKIEELCNKNGIDCYRGSEDNVLERYYDTAKAYSVNTVVRITSDCPLIDPHILDKMVRLYENSEVDIVYNGGNELELRTFPRGLDVEIFSFECLEKAYHGATEKYQMEHVTPYIYENFKKLMYLNETNKSHLRWTVDTEEDMTLIKQIYKQLYTGKHDFFYDEILELVEKNPELKEINNMIKQKVLKG